MNSEIKFAEIDYIEAVLEQRNVSKAKEALGQALINANSYEAGDLYKKCLQKAGANFSNSLKFDKVNWDKFINAFQFLKQQYLSGNIGIYNGFCARLK